jgi:hypothetical protein
MAKHKLDLRENAIDSFNEALSKYREGLSGNRAAFKFAILHLAHSLELLFKYYVSKSHPLLIYKNPFSKNIVKEQTIGLWDAVQFLANEGHTLDKPFYADLEWLKKLRNDIEHYAFDMDVPDVRKAMGRLVQAIREYHYDIGGEDIEEFVSKANLDLFNELADENKRDLANARTDAKELTEDGDIHDCKFCGHDDTAAMIKNRVVCQYCKEVDHMIDCCICGSPSRRSEAIVWNDDHEGHTDYACEPCDDRIRAMGRD